MVAAKLLALRAARRPAASKVAAAAAAASSRRSYTFASKGYVESFANKPPVDYKALRSGAIQYLETFDPQTWFQDPVCTILNGKKITDGEMKQTVDAFNQENGRQVLAPASVVDDVIAHVKSMNLKCNKEKPDLRKVARKVEDRMLSVHASALIGNQAVDFHKQDGVTEIEEALEANTMEKALNDQLLAAESRGDLVVKRNTAFVGCVSNFSNFLDLCKKSLRSLEVGTPVLILSRSNTTQHMYRWVQLLLEEMEKEGMDPAMVTYVSCTIEEQRRIMKALSDCPLYLTGSREVAAKIKELMPYTFSSTGGPNTMVTPNLDEETEAAVRMSTAIENSGQCTAMRHLVTNSCSKADLERIFQPVRAVDSSKESLESNGFDCVFRTWTKSFEAAKGYDTVQPTCEGSQPVAVRIDEELPKDIEEHWRRVYLDVSTPKKVDDPEYLRKLCSWLTTNQPISVAVNGDNEEAGFPIAQQLFEGTAQVVFSIGRKGNPSLTAQARPQDGEIFGEFPPRRELTKYTRSPIYTPSSGPSYMARYTPEYLASAASRVVPALGPDHASLQKLLQEATNSDARGYAVLLTEYLREACGPKVGGTVRTALWGLQKPPAREVSTIIRATSKDDLGTVAIHVLPFLVTNAREGLVVSTDGELPASLKEACEAAKVTVVKEDEAAFQKRCDTSDPWNVLTMPEAVTADELPMVDHFILTLLPGGHIKSTTPNDQDFIKTFEKSSKWLKFIGI
mmetsp:Transcript_922/g.2060  ORF Transcript_922/g.2060 Transcript_922/m.2060 type:complete len:737 (-) Transcript_922:44-2254(-)